MRDILKELNESYKIFQKLGGKGPQKLVPIHSFIACDLIEKTDMKYEVKSFGIGDSKEYVMDGVFNNKSLDVAILKEDNLLGMINFKFVMGNLSQNKNNYFEQMSGEFMNTPLDVVYGNLFVVFGTTPYKDKDGNIKKYERLNDSFFEKYKKFHEYNLLKTKKHLSVIIVEEVEDEIVLSDYRKYNIKKEYHDLLENEWLYPNFIKNFSEDIKKKATLYKRHQGVFKDLI